ncbi:FAD:protein FMN transferase [Candidatus Peregrinibacteria bacterium]|nr:MAG: FAD:protein FMN transferase [Candidatus Peregrinibacteria bacterium]
MMKKLPSYRWRAMGTEILLLSRFPLSQTLKEGAQHIFITKEQKFSRFLPQSLLSQLNREKTLCFDSDFFEVMRLCQKMHKKTKGTFNPLLSVRRLGYAKSWDFTGTMEMGDYNTNIDEIFLNDSEIRIADDQELDLGGILKGWTVDKVKEFLIQEGIEDFVIDAGGDIIACGMAEEHEPWRIGVENSGKIIELHDQALATSGRNRRHWKDRDGHEIHHVVNAYSKTSLETDLETITVWAETCAEADAWATASFSLGKIEGQNLLLRNDIPYFLTLSL